VAHTSPVITQTLRTEWHGYASRPSSSSG
jgi:hypothetical protein